MIRILLSVQKGNSFEVENMNSPFEEHNANLILGTANSIFIVHVKIKLRQLDMRIP